ncbi:regulatory protein, SyrP-like protein [Legionella beliardensis]|uniref:Regulatory protein, SyrP-like protein n=1 Tax=Legionella beliardensis TaxID=91822 RepID=A0A378I0P5_9GAMM|nr:TauD/TfdA family dioxygenase [Legionella beliardensis]STX28542.1 regulatory protein, SyrP-like protein [Legionella beliardensis]
MHNEYNQVSTRFLRDDERFVLSEEKEMPLVIEPTTQTDTDFLQRFLATHSKQLIKDMAKYGAVLLRGFDVASDKEFEKTVLSVPQFRGISEAFMAENGRTHVDDLKFVLHTNSVYKTGGTLYLGGFHTENYYSADVPGYIFFYCAKPSPLGGETGLINTQKIYQNLDQSLQNKLEKNSFFVSKWLVSEVAERYQLDSDIIEKIATYFDLPIVGTGKDRFILMYKPSVFIHPLTQEKALQINLFELPTLNDYLRTCFRADYQGSNWFWHRFFWSLPPTLFNSIESLAIAAIAFYHSPKNSYNMVRTKLSSHFAKKKTDIPTLDKVGNCFTKNDIKQLAQTMRKYYCSCLWQKGDILLIDNKKVMHAGMPGKGERVIRAMIANPIAMNYTMQESGILQAEERTTLAIGEYLSGATLPEAEESPLQSL